MSRSRHTAPPRVTATKSDGRPAGSRLRVIEGKPRPGDVHPIPRRFLSLILKFIPPEYTAGLLRVELRAREGELGLPYAVYRPRERAIIIYSVPRTWNLPHIPAYEQESMGSCGATIEQTEGAYEARWESLDGLSSWFARLVLFHELGHHYSYQYKRKFKLEPDRKIKEALADKYGLALLQVFHTRLDQGRARSAAAKSEDGKEPRD